MSYVAAYDLLTSIQLTVAVAAGAAGFGIAAFLLVAAVRRRLKGRSA